ncbi:cytochrome P450 4d8-like [Euwallacea similis]|uniref:cytochrome P450 4d8-like n=1 Tax=Euwallacea similis TaxID=1736056 RepID=UPI00344B0959
MPPLLLTIPLFFLLCLGVLYVISKIKKSQAKYLQTIPGPKPIFPFGNTLDFIQGSIVFLDNFLKYFKDHGDTIIIHDSALSWILVTVDYDLMEMVLSSSVHISKSNHYDFLYNWLGQGLLTSNGDKWKSHRKIITPAFHFSILQGFLPVFDSVGNNLVKKLRKEIGKSSLEISNLLSLFTLDVICETAMGTKINALDSYSSESSEYVRSIKIMCKILIERSYSAVPHSLYWLTWNYYKEKQALKVIHGHVDSVIEQKLQLKKNKEQFGDKLIDEGIKRKKAFLDLLLEAKIDGCELTKTELREEVNTFMFEGHDTSSSALTFVLLMLATYPKVQVDLCCKISTEYHRFCGDFKEVNISSAQLSQMKYLEMVIKETLRLYPPVPMFGRKLVKDVEFKGTVIPKGINVTLCPYAVHRKALYFENPEEFIPERFENFTGKLPFSYIPFSAGPRNCIGQKFAMMEILCTISKILRNFKLSPAFPEHKIQIVAESILISKNGVKISIQER